MSNPEKTRRPARTRMILAMGAAAMMLLAGCGNSESTSDGMGTADGSQGSAVAAPATGQTSFEALEVGQCLQFVAVPGETVNAQGNISVTHEVVDCTLTGQFKYLVTHSFDGQATCPNDEYTTYFQENLLGGQSKSFCVAPVYEMGACYDINDLQDPENVDCSSPNKVFMIESVLDGVDPSGCSIPEQASVIPEPAPGKVYCLVP